MKVFFPIYSRKHWCKKVRQISDTTRDLAIWSLLHALDAILFEFRPDIAFLIHWPWRTDRPTDDGPTDRRTDTTSCSDAITHLKAAMWPFSFASADDKSIGLCHFHSPAAIQVFISLVWHPIMSSGSSYWKSLMPPRISMSPYICPFVQLIDRWLVSKSLRQSGHPLAR